MNYNLYYIIIIIIAITERRARARHRLCRPPPGGACTRRLAPVQRHELGSPAPGLLHTSQTIGVCASCYTSVPRGPRILISVTHFVELYNIIHDNNIVAPRNQTERPRKIENDFTNPAHRYRVAKTVLLLLLSFLILQSPVTTRCLANRENIATTMLVELAVALLWTAGKWNASFTRLTMSTVRCYFNTRTRRRIPRSSSGRGTAK